MRQRTGPTSRPSTPRSPSSSPPLERWCGLRPLRSLPIARLRSVGLTPYPCVGVDEWGGYIDVRQQVCGDRVAGLRRSVDTPKLPHPTAMLNVNRFHDWCVVWRPVSCVCTVGHTLWKTCVWVCSDTRMWELGVAFWRCSGSLPINHQVHTYGMSVVRSRTRPTVTTFRRRVSWRTTRSRARCLAGSPTWSSTTSTTR
jgi:hypothetical protein